MRYLFGFAGIPKEILSEIEKENKKYAEAAEFWIDKMPNFAPYAERNIDFFTEKFRNKIATDTKNQLKETGFSIIYIVRDAASTEKFVRAFFPHTLMIPVQWELNVSGGKNEMLASKNELVEKLSKATAQARTILRVLRDQVVSQASNTPLLLPLRNFRSKFSVNLLMRLQNDLASSPEPLEPLRDYINSFVQAHPRRRPNGAKRDIFVDDRNVEFNPPGNDRHGFARAGGNHPSRCVLSGKRRLGAPYDPLFHYDCTKGTPKNLKANFFGCHEDETEKEGKPHLNISPNDHVR
ncbi:hypothetical protein [Burkholderia ubonensis]|uniref:hypothetical protein n=1 Tax=Burkholderia ubonensis TaxID=101571 RepID=UPI000AD0F5A2|nr:hypothetical protein [Burkholderia ubonensis]